MISFNDLKESDRGKLVLVSRRGTKEVGILKNWNRYCAFIDFITIDEDGKIVENVKNKAIGIRFSDIEFKPKEEENGKEDSKNSFS